MKRHKLSGGIKAKIHKTTGYKTGAGCTWNVPKSTLKNLNSCRCLPSVYVHWNVEYLVLYIWHTKPVFVEKAEANLEHLKPHDAMMPVNPVYTAQEWQDIYAAQKLSPEYSPNFKQGTEPQKGNRLCHIFEKSSWKNATVQMTRHI
jgi:hypothetical protein